MRGILFWIIILFLKPYLYISIYRFFDNKLFKRLTIVFLVFSIFSVVAGIYYMRTIFSGGLSAMTFWPNFSLALMLSFFICETLTAAFFLFQDILFLIIFLSKKIVNNSTS